MSNEDTLSHAYLFFGPKHALKSNLALAIAKHIEESETLQDTLQIPQSSDPPTGEELSKIGIEEVRQIRKFLFQTPRGKKRIVIIKDAENLTWQAMPALLKIIEEPPKHALIIFTAREKQSLSPALLSRLAKIYISPNENEVMIERKEGELSLAEEIEQRIIELYKKDKIKNTEAISFLLKKYVMATRFNLNPKLQKKAINYLQNL